MKKYIINFSFTLNGEQEICANSKEEAIEEFKYQSFMEVIENSGAFIDADQWGVSYLAGKEIWERLFARFTEN